MIEALIGPVVLLLGAGLPTALLIVLPELFREKPAAARRRIYCEETERRRLEHIAANARIRPMLKPGTPDLPWDPSDPHHSEVIEERASERLQEIGLCPQP